MTFILSVILLAVIVKAHLELSPHNGVLIVPGVAGSGLYGELKAANLKYCSNAPLTSPPVRLWASIIQGLPPVWRQRCWASKLMLGWGMSEHCEASRLTGRKSLCEDEYLPLPGVSITVDKGTHGVDYLDYVEGIGVLGTKYFHDFLETLRRVGYVDDDTLMAYTFDWRYPPWQQDYMEFKNLIEDFVVRHPGRKVMILTHSLGSVITNTFLTNSVNADWKNKHIEGFMSIAGAFGGSHKAIRSLLTGYPEATIIDFLGLLNITLIPAQLLRAVQRTFGSIYALTPSLEIFDVNEPVISIINPNMQRAEWLIGGCPVNLHLLSCLFKKLTESTSRSTNTPQYTLSDWWKLLPEPYQPLAYQAIEKSKLVSLEDPGVPVYCFWSRYSIPTTERAYIYPTSDVESTIPLMKLEYGDNTLLVESASHCKSWKSTVISREFLNLDHVYMIMDRGVIEFAVSLISGLPLLSINNITVE